MTVHEPITAADPVFTVDGTRQPDLARDCLALTITDSVDGLRRCEAHFLATSPRSVPQSDVVEYLDGAAFDFGQEIVVSLGPAGAERVVFAGRVSAIAVTFDEGDAPHVTVNAEDALYGLRQPRRSQTYTQCSDADLVRRIATRHGLSADVAVDGPTYSAVQQINESDLGFLRGRAARIGAELWVTGTTLHLALREKRSGETVTLTRGDDLVAVQLRADLADQRSAVRVSGFDAAGRSRVDEEAGSSALAGEVAGGRTAIDILERVGSRVEQRTLIVPLTAAEARLVAQASIRARARGFVTVDGIAAAAPQLAVASRLTLNDVGKPFSGAGYYVTGVKHLFARDSGGLRTHFTAERAVLRQGGA